MTGPATGGVARTGHPVLFKVIGPLLVTGLPMLATGGDLESCRGIASDSERLACYDSIADSTPAPVKPPASISAESLFGRDATQTSAVLQQQAGIIPPQTLDAKISSVNTRANGKQVLGLQNGQRWEQIDGRPLSLAPGDSIRIRKAAFGSWLLYRQSGGRSIRVRRTD